VRGLGFRYSNDRPAVLEGVNLDIPAGAKVALVGPSGSGKSTLLKLLAGTIVPTSGNVQYDGADLHGYDLEAVRRQLGVVPQHPFVFGSTVRENIALTDPSASRERVESVARLASLHADIAAMPLGYDTPISDGGSSLSGGQRQRIAIARALLREPRVLLFDEATSALDNQTEAQIVDHVRRLGCTQITVAHRLSTIQSYDLIVVMDRGRVIEQGTHAQLLANQGLYHRLVVATAAPSRKEPSHVQQAASVPARSVGVRNNGNAQPAGPGPGRGRQAA
jgi:ATP-binding cassette, subfamily B, bacterial